jgi:chromosome segregation ATPase
MATDTEITVETATDETPDEQRDEAMPEGLSDGGKAALKAERDARKLAAKEAREAKAELDRLRAEKAEADRIKAEQDEAEAVKRGEFETLATKRAEELKTVAGERDSLKTEVAELRAAVQSSIDEKWNGLPEEVRELYDGDANNIVGRIKFMNSPAITKLIGKLTETQDATRDKFAAASRTRTPTPDTSGKQDTTPLVPAKF